MLLAVSHNFPPLKIPMFSLDMLKFKNKNSLKFNIDQKVTKNWVNSKFAKMISSYR